MVRVEVPAGVLADVVMVRVELPDPDTDAGLNDPVAPVGRPVTPKFTLPVNPAIAEMVAVKVVVPPTVTDCELGAAAIEKSGTVTIKETLDVWVRVPDVAVITSG